MMKCLAVSLAALLLVFSQARAGSPATPAPIPTKVEHLPGVDLAVGISQLTGVAISPLLGVGAATVAMPASSGNGRWVVFVSNVDNPGSTASVYKVKSDGTELTRLTSTGDDLAPQFAATP